MCRLFAIAVLCYSAVACNQKASDSNKPRPGETIEARVALPPHWKHGKSGMLSVVYELRRPEKSEPIQLEATDLPPQFLPDLYIAFQSEAGPIGEPLRLFFDPDC